MRWFLDTNVCIYAINCRSEQLIARMRAHNCSAICIPSMVLAELAYGAGKSERPDRAIQAVRLFLSPYEVVPFCSKAAMEYGRIRSYLEKRGTTIGPNDLVVASIVLGNAGALVTHDTSEFERVPGLTVEDWTK